jgi:hypothetical protein
MVHAGIVAILIASFLLSGCFLTPERSAPGADDPMFLPPTLVPTAKPTSAPTISVDEGTKAAACTDILTYVQDISIPDGTVVNPNAAIDKAWEVKNSGTCDWVDGYLVKWIGGSKVGGENEQPLVSAKAGSSVNINMNLKAPAAPGKYRSAWQAVNPQGFPFGDAFYIEFVVQVPTT